VPALPGRPRAKVKRPSRLTRNLLPVVHLAWKDTLRREVESLCTKACLPTCPYPGALMSPIPISGTIEFRPPRGCNGPARLSMMARIALTTNRRSRGKVKSASRVSPSALLGSLSGCYPRLAAIATLARLARRNAPTWRLISAPIAADTHSSGWQIEDQHGRTWHQVGTVRRYSGEAYWMLPRQASSST
jgi:hypothetical protein